MSIMRCDNCDRPIDTDEAPLNEVAGEMWCDDCLEDLDEEEDEDE